MTLPCAILKQEERLGETACTWTKNIQKYLGLDSSTSSFKILDPTLLYFNFMSSFHMLLFMIFSHAIC